MACCDSLNQRSMIHSETLISRRRALALWEFSNPVSRKVLQWTVPSHNEKCNTTAYAVPYIYNRYSDHKGNKHLAKQVSKALQVTYSRVCAYEHAVSSYEKRKKKSQ